ncbi:MAG: glycosyltransferase family 2 protein [Myxococcota bacterium]
MDRTSLGSPDSDRAPIKLATKGVCPDDAHRGTPQVDATARHTPTPAQHPGDPWLSIVLPAHNEADCIAQVVEDFCNAASQLAQHGQHVEIVVVDDASQDNTAECVRQIAAPAHVAVRLVQRRTQGGYGRAVITGLENARGRWLFFSDADGQFDAHQLPGFLSAIEEDDVDMIIGYRSPRHDPWHRRLMGRLWTTIVRATLRIPVRDVNCAYKAFRRRDIARMRLTSDGALINAELLHKARRMNLAIVQRPVRHRARLSGQPSGARPTVILKAFGELLSYRLTTQRWGGGE